MELEQLVPGIIGAFVGVIGWLFVGIHIQRRQFMRQARNAARAVYFEIDVNRVAVTVARDFGSFTPLDRTSFERHLPELATLLGPEELKRIVSAYMAHAGYRQASNADELPAEVRRHALDGILVAHDQALDTLRTRAFSPREARALGAAPTGSSASTSTSTAAEAKRPTTAG